MYRFGVSKVGATSRPPAESKYTVVDSRWSVTATTYTKSLINNAYSNITDC